MEDHVAEEAYELPSVHEEALDEWVDVGEGVRNGMVLQFEKECGARGGSECDAHEYES